MALVTVESRVAHLSVVQGDTLIRDFRVDVGEPATPSPITGSQVWFTIRRDRSALNDSNALVQVGLGTGITVVDDDDGHGRITCAAAQMAVLQAGEYWYDLQYTPPGGSIVVTLQLGRLTVVGDVTKRLPV